MDTGNHVKISPQDARQGAISGRVRTVLFVSLAGAVAALAFVALLAG
jgi:hypothetical protein